MRGVSCGTGVVSEIALTSAGRCNNRFLVILTRTAINARNASCTPPDLTADRTPYATSYASTKGAPFVAGTRAGRAESEALLGPGCLATSNVWIDSVIVCDFRYVQRESPL